jgi:hypothetical protein
MDIPHTVRQWNVTSYDGKKGFDALEYSDRPISALGDSEVLVKRALTTWRCTKRAKRTDEILMHYSSARGVNQCQS